MRLTVTIDLDLTDAATDGEVIRLLGAIAAQVEDDEDGIICTATMDAPHPTWQEME